MIKQYLIIVFLFPFLTYAQDSIKLKNIEKVVSKIDSNKKLRKYIAYDSVRKISNDIQLSWPQILEYYSDNKTKDFVKIIARSKPGSKNYLELVFYYENRKLIKAKVKERIEKNKIYGGSNIESVLYYNGNILLKKFDVLDEILDPKVYFLSAYQFANFKPS